MHGAHQAPSMTNWTQFVQTAPHVRQQRLRELEQTLRQQMAGTARRCLPDPRHGPFSAKAGSPLHQAGAMQVPAGSFRVANRMGGSASAHASAAALTSGAAPTRKVTFNLPGSRPPGGSALARSRSSLYRSASDGTLDTDFQPEYQRLRTQRHLPEQPLDRAPLSPTLPMAKLRLQRQWTSERLAAAAANSTSINECLNQSQISAGWSSGAHHHAVTSHAHSVPSSPIKRPLATSVTGRPLMTTGGVGGGRLLNTTVDQHVNRLRQRLPVCKSSPPSAVLGNSSTARAQTPVGRQIAKYGDSPATQMRRELRFFAQERKKEMQEAERDERATYLGPYPPAWHQQLSSSDSDLNALLDLWSRPPDPVRDRQPPAGAANLQRVPQYMLGTSGTSLHELRPTPTRRASYGCGGLYGPASRHSTGASLYGTSAINACNSLNNLGYGTSFEYDVGPLGPGRSWRPVVRYGSCGRLDEFDPTWYGNPTASYDLSLARDLNNNLVLPSSSSSSYAQNSRHWSNNSKNCVTLLPTRPYRL